MTDLATELADDEKSQVEELLGEVVGSAHPDPDAARHQEARRVRLFDAIEGAKVGGRSIDGARIPLIAGSILAPLGLLMIGVAWRGVANTGILFEQLPFLVSGGLGGLAFVVLGGFLYFSWWTTVGIREARQHARQQEDTTRLLLDEVRALAAANERLVSELTAARHAAMTPVTVAVKRTPIRARRVDA